MQDFVAQRSSHIASATPGLDAARTLSDMTDEAVRELARAASGLHEGRFAICALGGWGSGALLPASDLDILILSETAAPKLRPFVEALLYPLWDAGLKVGHQVRSPKQQRTAMLDDLQTMTAALTARPLAGDTAWASEVLAGCASHASKRASRRIAELHTRDRPGSPWLLQPDLKNGAGGRRDYDELTWTAALLGKRLTHHPDPLAGCGLLSFEELASLHDAAEKTATARWVLQRDGAGDVLSIDYEVALAQTIDPEVVQMALGDTAVLLERVRARIASRDRHHICDPAIAPVASRQLSGPDVFELADAGRESIDALLTAGQEGCLDGLVPGFRRLMATRRPGLGHQLTVGAHCIESVGILHSLADEPTLAGSVNAVGDLRVATVAALVHDVGKAQTGGDHAVQGVAPARAAAHAFGLDDADAETVADLVRLHLALVETALREDLDDEDAILRCAARIARSELLAPLHVLTAADSKATGPSTWTPWTAALIATLVARLDAAFGDEVDGAGIAQRGERTRTAALELVGTDAAGAARAFVEAAPLRYLASRSPQQVRRDALLVGDLHSGGSARDASIAVSAGPAPETHIVTIAARNRPRLLARLAGAVALAGLDILSVDAYSAPGGVALDSFVVVSATRNPVTTQSFSALERFVDAALRDRLELATRLAERRRHYPTRRDDTVEVTTRRSGWDTAVEVVAPDRPGLLHDIAGAIATEDVDIRWAKALTVEGMARDTFHVVGPDGGPVDDPGVLGHLAMRIREAV